MLGGTIYCGKNLALLKRTQSSSSTATDVYRCGVLTKNRSTSKEHWQVPCAVPS